MTQPERADFTFGTAGAQNNQIKTPTGAIVDIVAKDDSGNALNYQTNNAELMAVLMDMETYPNGQRTINWGHVKNPQRNKFLNAKMVSDTRSPGVGSDGVYRDPWGNPYIITLDLNYNDKACDSFYARQQVSQDPADINRGLNGLIKRTLPGGGAVVFEANSPVMVWSAGPDKRVDPTVKANVGANKDNILTWR